MTVDYVRRKVINMPRLFAAHENIGMSILLHCLDNPRNAYLIGAGVSSEQVSVTGGLSNVVAKKWLSMGSYDASVPPHGTLFSGLGLGSLFEPQDLKHELLWRIYDKSIRSILYIHFSKGLEASISDSYRIFRRFPSPIAIYNMNVDGIALRIKAPGLVVLNLHGAVANDINWASKENSELGDELVELGVELPVSNGIWYPEREPPSITSTTPYKQAKSYLRRAKRLFVLGYSFGAHDSNIDDFETFSFFCEMIRDYHIPVVVLNLRPEMLVDSIGYASGTKSIVGIVIDWNIFARSVFSVPAANKWPLLPLLYLENEILLEYRRLLNQR
jgi:hypothetical protein